MTIKGPGALILMAVTLNWNLDPQEPEFSAVCEPSDADGGS